MTQAARVRIVVPGDDPPQIAGSPHLERLRPCGDVVLHATRPTGPDDQLERARDADVLINSRGHVRWPGDLLRRLPRLRMIATCSIGTDAVDVAAARELGIVVSNIPGRTAEIVAEHALALLLATARRLAFRTAELKAGRWVQKLDIHLRGRTLGVIGTGHIGSAMIRLARAIGMDVVAWTFHPRPELAAQLGFRHVEFDELLRTADAVSVHVKLTPESRHLLGPREFGLLKPGCLLVNTSRGAVIDSAALVESLRSGRLGGAGLDVFETEPLPPDDPLLACEQVVLTPHSADQTPEGMDILNAGAVENVLAFLAGRPQNDVTRGT
jgi:D-3-phosphoglycerate dehydrogenase